MDGGSPSSETKIFWKTTGVLGILGVVATLASVLISNSQEPQTNPMQSPATSASPRPRTYWVGAPDGSDRNDMFKWCADSYSNRTPAGNKPTATFTRPVKGDKIPERFPLCGTFTNVDGDTLWLVTAPIGNGTRPRATSFHPQPRAPRGYREPKPEGNFHLGPDPGKWAAYTAVGTPESVNVPFELLIVRTDERVDSEFREYLTTAIKENQYPGLLKLPQGANILTKITVRRCKGARDCESGE